jgi:cyclopropane fatty-acyl-phospholipid synthase-like methyltransferase
MNTFLYIVTILATIFIVMNIKKNKLLYFVIIYLTIFACLEILNYLGIPTWDQTERTINCYNWFEHYIKKDYDKDDRFDYSESLFFENYDLSGKEATMQKYNYIYKELNLSPGKKLLDCGCGIGTFMEFCKKRGVHVLGYTLSEEQAKVIRKKGMEVIVGDYRILNKELIGKFDAISILGSSEHITSCKRINRDKNIYDTYYHLFNVLNQYLKSGGNMLLTVLVKNNSSFTFNDYTQGYIMERHYGGHYGKGQIIENAIKDNNLEVVYVKDFTKDYHWISVKEPEHFGHWWVHWNENPIDKILYIIKGIFTDPFLIHHWLYYGRDTWMWQFGGYQKTPLTDKQVNDAPANLKYFKIHKNNL